MKNIIKKFEIFTESSNYQNNSSKNIVTELCISMILLNNKFLDNLLDNGIKSRYTENSNVFLTDLKNLLLSKNRLKLGKFIDDKCVVDEEISKINSLFDDNSFNIEKDWKSLIDSRVVARAIIDKLIPDEKLSPNFIKNLYWIGPNKTDDYKEDIVIELTDDRQFSIFLNRNLSNTKTASFNKFMEDLIGENLDIMYKDNYIDKWDKLTKEWVSLIYENVNKNIQEHIEKFINLEKIKNITYFEYFNIKHSDNRYKYLGEYIKEFNRNILNLSDLLSQIWKDRKSLFIDVERVEQEWYDAKTVILNSKILENILTTSLKNNFLEDIKKLSDGYKIASGKVKMKLFKIIIDKMDCLERNIYIIDKNGSNFYLIPSKQFFRKYYEDLNVLFDYHVKFLTNKDEENSDFIIKLKLIMGDNLLMNMNINVKFSGGEMSGKLSAKYNYNLSSDFNYLISKKENEN